MSFGKRLRNFALGLGAMAGVGIAAERSIPHEDEPVPAKRVLTPNEISWQKHLDSQMEFYQSPEGKAMLERENRRHLADSKAGKALTDKNSNRLLRVLATPPATNTATRETQLKIRAKTLEQVLGDFDIAKYQERDDDVLEILLRDGTAGDLKMALANPLVEKSARSLLEEYRERLQEKLDYPPVDEAGKRIREPENVEYYNQEVKDLKDAIKKLSTNLPPVTKVK